MLILSMHFNSLHSGTRKYEDDAEAEVSCVRVRLPTLRKLQMLVFR